MRESLNHEENAHPKLLEKQKTIIDLSLVPILDFLLWADAREKNGRKAPKLFVVRVKDKFGPKYQLTFNHTPVACFLDGKDKKTLFNRKEKNEFELTPGSEAVFNKFLAKSKEEREMEKLQDDVKKHTRNVICGAYGLKEEQKDTAPDSFNGNRTMTADEYMKLTNDEFLELMKVCVDNIKVDNHTFSILSNTPSRWDELESMYSYSRKDRET